MISQMLRSNGRNLRVCFFLWLPCFVLQTWRFLPPCCRGWGPYNQTGQWKSESTVPPKKHQSQQNHLAPSITLIQQTWWILDHFGTENISQHKTVTGDETKHVNARLVSLKSCRICGRPGRVELLQFRASWRNVYLAGWRRWIASGRGKAVLASKIQEMFFFNTWRNPFAFGG